MTRPLLLRTLFKLIRIQPALIRPSFWHSRLRRFWSEKVTKYTQNVINFDIFTLVPTFLRINCIFGVIPYAFQTKSNELSRWQGWRWPLWMLIYGILLPLRLGLSLCVPLFTPIKLEQIGNRVGVDALNLIVYLVLLQIIMLYPPVIHCFVTDSALVARMLRLYFQLDSTFSGKFYCTSFIKS